MGLSKHVVIESKIFSVSKDGCFMPTVVLTEYSVGSRRSFIFILEEKQGWRRLAKALWEFAPEGRGFNIKRWGTFEAFGGGTFQEKVEGLIRCKEKSSRPGLGLGLLSDGPCIISTDRKLNGPRKIGSNTNGPSSKRQQAMLMGQPQPMRRKEGISLHQTQSVWS